ncbi:hypothetical protein Poli38472_013932 [Pythium oligandrum]|uniref:Sel1 repeat family protein n=1 Tax=Pythium oligandrum TaxID=41045 RepID=A0A8K1F9F8_PYTOL|nr:hypothetical protein Poli38472_013932 [Pythium oligandrum]|eukprot:TMW55170.1 hypothetical protein Poli38472_013932 [Pythium oligandrum]
METLRFLAMILCSIALIYHVVASMPADSPLLNDNVRSVLKDTMSGIDDVTLQQIHMRVREAQPDAMRYNEGRGVTMDPQRALELLEDATKLGSPHALFYLGVMHEYGRGVKQDFFKAAELYLQASEQDVVDAIYYLGLLHGSGRGVPLSFSTAVTMFQRAAERRHAPSMLRLGELHALGEGVPIDYSVALYWFKQAATANDARVSQRAAKAAEELQGVLSEAEAHVQEQERVLGVPLRVKVASIEGS